MDLTVREAEAVIEKMTPEKLDNLIAVAEENLKGWDVDDPNKEVRDEMIRIVRFTDYRDLV